MNQDKRPGPRILIVDDHAVVREGLRRLLELQPGLSIVGEGADGEEALAIAAELAPDIVLLDISMPKMNGIEAARRLRRLKPGIRIIMISMNDDAGHIMDSFRAGAMGYIVKDAAPDEIAQAIAKVHGGGFYCSETVCRRLANDLAGGARLQEQVKKAKKLPALHRKVLSQLTEDVDAKALADRLGAPLPDVEAALEEICGELQVAGAEDLRLLALKLYLVGC